MKKLLGITLSLFISISAFQAQANEYIAPVCEATKDLLSARMASFSDELEVTDKSLEDDGHGGPDPLYYDRWTGVWVDPVSGLIGQHQTEFGDVTDSETGAKFYKPRGLWVDPKTLEPVRNARLNKFPYYDPKTHETIDPKTGSRWPYLEILKTIGASRTAAHRVRYACLGDDLRMRIDPVTGKYLKRAGGAHVDDTLFYTFDETNDKRRTAWLNGKDNYVPLGFVPYRQYDTDILREGLGLTNGISRNSAVKIIYDKFAPESSESGSYELHEARISNGIVTQITARGLMDDAVSAVQILLFFDTSMKGRDRLLNVGVRQKCGRLNSTQAWIRERC